MAWTRFLNELSIRWYLYILLAYLKVSFNWQNYSWSRIVINTKVLPFQKWLLASQTVLQISKKGYYNIRRDVSDGSKCFRLEFSSSIWKLKWTKFIIWDAHCWPPADIYFGGVNLLWLSTAPKCSNKCLKIIYIRNITYHTTALIIRVETFFKRNLFLKLKIFLIFWKG